MSVVANAVKLTGFAAWQIWGLAILAGVVGVFGSYFIWKHKVFKEGVKSCEDKQIVVNTEQAAKLDAANQIIAANALTIESLRQQLKVQRPVAQKAAQEILNANPNFSNLARPDSLYVQRVRELEEIRRAATGD